MHTVELDTFIFHIPGEPYTGQHFAEGLAIPKRQSATEELSARVMDLRNISPDLAVGRLGVVAAGSLQSEKGQHASNLPGEARAGTHDLRSFEATLARGVIWWALHDAAGQRAPTPALLEGYAQVAQLPNMRRRNGTCHIEAIRVRNGSYEGAATLLFSSLRAFRGKKEAIFDAVGERQLALAEMAGFEVEKSLSPIGVGRSLRLSASRCRTSDRAASCSELATQVFPWLGAAHVPLSRINQL